MESKEPSLSRLCGKKRGKGEDHALGLSFIVKLKRSPIWVQCLQGIVRGLHFVAIVTAVIRLIESARQLNRNGGRIEF